MDHIHQNIGPCVLCKLYQILMNSEWIQLFFINLKANYNQASGLHQYLVEKKHRILTERGV